MINKTEGVILDSSLYQEHDYIIALFTPDLGMIRLFVPRKKSPPLVPTTLTRVECLYSQRQENALFRLKELVVRDPLLDLRKSFQALRLAGTLAQTLLQTQLLWKPAPALYQLFLAYLHHAPNCSNPAAFVASFLLKLLRHEGLLGLNAVCATCASPLERAALIPGETLCTIHAPTWAIHFEHAELLTLGHLAGSRELNTIYHQVLTQDLIDKVNHLFDQLTDS